MGYGVIRARGDYGVARGRGDPFLGGIVGAVVGGVGLVKKAASVVKKLKGSKVARVAGGAATVGALTMPGGIPLPGGRTMHPTKLLPGGQPFIEGPRKRRRMNVANAKALRRAIRRTDGFVKLARRTLKGTGFTVSRRGLSRAARTRKR